MNEGKVHQIGVPFEKRGAPTGPDRARAFDKVNPKTGARPDRSFLKNYNPKAGRYSGVEYDNEEEYTMVLVMGDGKEFSYGDQKDPWTEYYGVNVLLFPNGKVQSSTADPTSKAQWAKDKDKIIKAAKDYVRGKTPFTIKEDAMMTFKQYLSESSHASVDIKGMDIEDLIDCHRNAGYNVSRSEMKYFIDCRYEGYKNRQHSYVVMMKNDYDDGDGSGFYLTRFFVHLGESGKIEAEPAGTPFFENDDEGKVRDKFESF